MTTTSYSAPLGAPQARDHLIQLYTDDGFLGRAVTEFLGAGLRGGEAAIIIGTSPHQTLFRERLTATGVDVGAAEASGQLVLLDAEASLARFMVDGMPDRDRFFGLVRPLLAASRARGFVKSRLYGEMVDLLWNHSMPATVALEELWNDVLAETGVALLCAYRIDNFDPRAHRGVLHQISACHSELIPVEDYARLDRAVARAYEDVFGTAGDAEILRGYIAAEHRPKTKMPPAQAALFGLREFAPSVAHSVLDRARHYYRE